MDYINEDDPDLALISVKVSELKSLSQKVVKTGKMKPKTFEKLGNLLQEILLELTVQMCTEFTVTNEEFTPGTDDLKNPPTRTNYPPQGEGKQL